MLPVPRTYIAMCETDSLQSLWSVLSPTPLSEKNEMKTDSIHFI
jgi:hypothetical protein